MKLICTAPCSPACGSEATGVLLNSKSRALLGYNCAQHFRALNKDDYALEPLPAFAEAKYPKLSSDEYEFSFMVRGGVYTYLKQVSTGKVKTFYQVAHDIDSLPALRDHMNSLTDDLCSQWFNEREKKVKKPKAEAAS